MIGKLQCVVLDCPNVLELAPFYQSLLGGTVNRPDPRWAVDEGFATLHTEAGLVLAFQRVEAYQAPRWPDSAYPQQFHLDLEVADLEEAEKQVLGLGAALLHTDPGGWKVFADPAGHPFCLLGLPPGRLMDGGR